MEADFPVLREWIARDYALETEGVIRLTEEGFSLSDHLGPLLVSESYVRSTISGNTLAEKTAPSESIVPSERNMPPRTGGEHEGGKRPGGERLGGKRPGGGG